MNDTKINLIQNGASGRGGVGGGGGGGGGEEKGTHSPQSVKRVKCVLCLYMVGAHGTVASWKSRERSGLPTSWVTGIPHQQSGVALGVHHVVKDGQPARGIEGTAGTDAGWNGW